MATRRLLGTWNIGRRGDHRAARRSARRGAAGERPTAYRPWAEGLEERALLSTFTVLNTLDGGSGSLRQAIVDANLSAGPDTIAFSIAGSGVQTIRPTTPLPDVTDPVTIDGTTQPGFAGSPLIELNGGLAAGASGLSITAGSSTVRGLVINGFASAAAISLTVKGGNTIEGNYLGTNAGGTAALGNTYGVLSSSANNTIGGTAAGARNVISGNSVGVFAFGFAGTGNQVLGNLIGTNAAGTAAVANGGGVIFSSSGNVVGGTAAGSRNIIAGNTGNGVTLRGAGNRVEGNFVGMLADGSTPLANQYGVYVEDASNNVIGGTASGAGNLLTGNSSAGVYITAATFGPGATGNRVEGNLIGTNSTGSAAVSNQFYGVYITGAAGNTVGGTAAGSRNVISGRTWGVWIIGTKATANRIQGNFIGTNASGSAALPNTWGVYVSGAPGNFIGGTAAGAGNLISGNTQDGVHLDASGATGNRIEGNVIGLNALGTATLRNSNGVAIASAPNNIVGGTVSEARNVISGNGTGVAITGTTGTQILGNYIGTTPNGAGALGNSTGIFMSISSAQNTVGGTAAGAGNVVSGNTSVGIAIGNTSTPSDTGTTGNRVLGNFIGTNAAGTGALPQPTGVQVAAPGNTVGGTTAGAGNVISGNDTGFGSGTGVLLVGSGATGNQVLGNSIGTTPDGLAALPNFNGVVIRNASNNTVGGVVAGARNVISGNRSAGMTIETTGTFTASGNLVQGNFIGTDASGTADLHNGTSGIRLLAAAKSNQIGSPGAGANRIAFHSAAGFAGVSVVGTTATGNAIRGNEIFSNRLGIDLGTSGVTPNDAGDADTGPNNLQNFPVLGAALASGAKTRFQGTLNSAPSTTYTLDFYANTAANATGYGEGRRYLGATTVTTDAAGDASFDVVLAAATADGEQVSATATDPGGNTSEFAANVAVVVINQAPTDVALAGASVSEGSPGGTTVGTLSTTDPDDGDTHSYTLLDDAGGRFRLVGDQVQVADGAQLDYEAASRYVIRVGTTDSGGLSFEKDLTVAITNVNEAPVADDLSRTTDEDTAVAGQATGSDPDGDALTFAVATNPAHGTLAFQLDGSFTYTPDADYVGTDQFTYTASDGTLASGSATVTVTVLDRTPPTTTVGVAGVAGANGWYVSGVTVTLSAADAFSGVSATSYRLDGGPELAYAGPVAVDAEGVHTLAYWSTDGAGNAEAVQALTLKIDRTAPTIVATRDGQAYADAHGGWNSGPVTVTFAADDGGGSGVTSPAPDLFAGDGEFTSAPRTVTDLAGNVSAPSNTFAIRIDTTAPVTSASLSGTPGSNGSFVSGVTVALSVDETGSGTAATWYRVDGGSWQPYAGSFAVSSDGLHAVDYSSGDVAGNVEAVRTATFTIDTTPPDVSAPDLAAESDSGVSDADNLTNLGTLTFRGTAEAGSTVRLREGTTLLGTFAADGSGQWGASIPLDPGTHDLHATATDEAGNTATSGAIRVVVDASAPALSLPADQVFEATGPLGATVHYLGADATDAVGPVTLTYSQANDSAFALGESTVTVTATDAAGNATSGSFLVTVGDTTAPVVVPPSLDPVEATGASGAPVAFAATASDAVTASPTIRYSVDGVEIASGRTFPVGTTTVTVTATDDAGNVGSASFDVTVTDADGVDDSTEDNSPNGGDGNGDGVLDSQQVNVTSLPAATGGGYLTLASPGGTVLDGVQAVANPAPTPPPAGVEFPVGFFNFAVQAIAPGASTTVTVFLPAGSGVNTYYKYGPTPDDPTPHWYPFLYDAATGTGAEFFTDKIVLHFVDGQRGDDDLTANGRVVDPGAPGIDTTAPTITASADRATLWSPNGAFVPVTVRGRITDLGAGIDPASVTYTVVDEYGQVQPSGGITLASDGTFAFTVNLQASRKGQDKDGRSYRIRIQASDRVGNVSVLEVGVLVPHDQRK